MKPSVRTNAMRETLAYVAMRLLQWDERAKTDPDCLMGDQHPTLAHRAAFRALASELKARAAGHRSRPHPRHRRSDHG